MAKKHYTYEEGLKFLANYCIKQDRCYKEINQKFWDMSWGGEDYEDYRNNALFYLMQNDFLNEQRYAKSFVRGKFRMKGWGRQKIERELKLKEVSKYNITKALESEIDENEYKRRLYSILEKKNRTIKSASHYERRVKLIRHATYSGYEASLISEAVSEIISEM